ncbi:hypothetical protein ABZT04_31225 [Streptomyces sp. NPDC005492]
MFQGDTVVGSQAKRSAATAPDQVVQFIKRYGGIQARPPLGVRYAVTT